MRIVFCVVGLFLLAACQGPEKASPEYFPLNEGWRWTYDVQQTFMGKVSLSEHTVHNQGRRDFNQETVYVRQTSDGTDYFMRSTDKVIERIAKRTRVQFDPIADPETRPVLRYPLTIGSSWAYATPVFLLQRRRINSSDYQSMRDESPVLMNFTIEEKWLRVETPAGVFEDCVKVVGQAVRSLFADSSKGFVDVPVTQNEWYCKEAGLVRFERHETLNSEFFEGGSVLYELISLEKD